MRQMTLGRILAGWLVVLAAAQGPAWAAGPPTGSAPAAPSPERPAFRSFLEGLWPEAQAAGISRATFDAAFRDLAAPEPRIVALTRGQSEFSRPIADYVAGAASPGRVARGRALAESWSSVLDGVERRYGVERGVILAIWGLESGFGVGTGGFSVVRSLATLAFIGHRGDLFRKELVNALRILEGEHLDRATLTGSWAGAMGQTQFMPSSFLAHAVDGDGDGRRDIWNSVPDVLASTANFLAQSGWRTGLPWGFELALPDGMDLSVHRRAFAEWARMGVKRSDGRPLPRAGEASLFLPAGIEGPAFLLTDNFEAIRAYNTSDSYALGVGLLADRIAGGNPLARAWPKGSVLSGEERREVHRRLAARGLYTGTPDGKFGAQTRDAVRRFQVGAGLLPDGYADIAVLEALRAR
jgi:membrane-bound lytic murein transglycosylase B